MKFTAHDRVGAGRPASVPATPHLATAPSRHIAPGHGAANADEFRPTSRQVIEASAARIVRAIAGVAQGLRDGLDRRRAVRELRLLGRSRLADIGIEPHDVERVVDDMIAARRSRAAAEERRARRRTE